MDAIAYDNQSPSRPSLVLLALGIYFALQIVVRLLHDRALDIDEAEQMIVTQWWAWNYGAQPPLYTWLQKMIFLITQPGPLGLSLLKNALLFLMFAFTYLSGRKLLHDSWRPVLATLALLLIPQISWESQRDLTHSVLATCMSAVTFHAFLCAVERRTALRALWLGACIGLGVLSKYNFALFAAALFIGALFSPRGRRVVLHPSVVLTLCTAALIIIPHLGALMEHQRMIDAAAFEARVHEAVSRWEGVVSLGLAVVSALGALAAVTVLVFPPNLPGGKETLREETSLPISAPAYAMTALLIALALVVVFEIPDVKTRWLQPLVVIAPLLLFAHSLTVCRHRTRIAIYVSICAVTAIIVLGAMALRMITEARAEPDARSASFAELGEALLARIPEDRIIVMSDEPVIGGNLLMHLPHAVAYLPALREEEFAERAERETVVFLWEIRAKDKMPPAFKAVLGKITGKPQRFPPDEIFELLYTPQDRSARKIGYCSIEPDSPRKRWRNRETDH